MGEYTGSECIFISLGQMNDLFVWDYKLVYSIPLRRLILTIKVRLYVQSPQSPSS